MLERDSVGWLLHGTALGKREEDANVNEGKRKPGQWMLTGFAKEWSPEIIPTRWLRVVCWRYQDRRD